MLKNIQAIRGMNDFLPNDSALFRYIEKILIGVLVSYGYNEIRLPILEATSLFKRAIGNMTDVVAKEMYSFIDRNGVSITLRPEGTASCVRAGIEHGLFYNNPACRLWYIGPMFRRDRPQKGRYRQFYQLSAEIFGHAGPNIDAELIVMTARFWRILGISEYLKLELNSIGSLSSRSLYCKALLSFLVDHINILDENSRKWLYSNPIRILDSKDQSIQKVLHDAPVLTQYLDIDSRMHFDELCRLLDVVGVAYTINPRLVRGLDYYNRTVFEWTNNVYLGAQNAVCSGGRYDDLVSHLGGISTPAVGCAVGLDRLCLLMKSIACFQCDEIISIGLDVYIIVSQNINKYESVILLAENIRDVLPKIRLQIDYSHGSIKKKFKRALKYGSRVLVIMNEVDEFKNQYVLFRDLLSGKQERLLQSLLISKLLSIFKDKTFHSI